MCCISMFIVRAVVTVRPNRPTGYTPFTHIGYIHVQCESKKIPPIDLWQFFQNGWEFCNQILYAYYAFLSTLDCKSLLGRPCTVVTGGLIKC